MTRTRVSIETSELARLVTLGLQRAGLDLRDAAYVAHDLVAAEQDGKPTHGVIQFDDICRDVANRSGPPVVQRTGPVATIDGRKELGHLVARQMVSLSLEIAAEHQIALVTAQNYSYYARLGGFVREVAMSGYIAILLNSGGPPAVAPYGSTQAVLGTNPISFGFPRAGDQPLMIDMASAEQAWGQIRLAIATGGTLPSNAFLDRDGRPTSDPDKAAAVLPFGGAKGSALALAIEILGGALLGLPTGLRVVTQYELGALLIVIDPRRFGRPGDFEDEVQRLCADLTKVGARVPGDRTLQPNDEQPQVAVFEDVLLSLKAAVNE